MRFGSGGSLAHQPRPTACRMSVSRVDLPVSRPGDWLRPIPATANIGVRGLLPRPQTKETTVAEETYEGEFYCVKCKEKREAKGIVVVNDKGTKMAKAKCPVCSTNLNRILGRA